MAFEINVQDFIDEAEDQIRVLNDGLLALEKDKKNEEIINEVFRAAHTLKGGSGLVGFSKMTELTHSLESIFDLIREKELELTSSHLDVMFEVLDILMELMGEVETGQFNTDIVAVSKKLKAILEAQEEVKKAGGKKTSHPKEPELADVQGYPEAQTASAKVEKGSNNKGADDNSIEEKIVSYINRPLTKEELATIDSVKQNGEPLYGVKIRISDACDVASLFMFMMFNKIREIGELIVSIPAEDELEDDDCKNLNIIISSIVPKDDVYRELNMPEIESIVIEALTDDGETEHKAEAPKPVVQAVVKEEPKVHKKESVVSFSQEEDDEEDSHKETGMVAKDAPRESDHSKKSGSTTLRVDSSKIDSLLNLAGELVINKARFMQIQSDLERELGKNSKIGELKDTVVQLMRITNEVQEGIMQLRMVAIDQVFSKFPRVVRDISRKLDKKIELVIEGKDTELDKSVVEEIGDPLMHLVRNSVDHGIETVSERIAAGKPETGIIKLKAYHQGSSIIIEIEDNGHGVNIDLVKKKAISKNLITEEDAFNMTDKEAVNLIFLPGFSTAAVVSDLSGRGVGMDVVKRNVERLNGVVEIVTEQGKGSVFSIKLPLTLAIISTLLTKVTRFVYAIPLVNVIEIVEVAKKDISKIATKEAIKIRNEVINILRLDEIFNLGSGNRGKEKVQIVIVGVAGYRVGFVVDELIGEQEVVIKSLDNSLIDSPGIAGASILGDGNVALIIDVSTLIDKVIQGYY